MVGILAAIGIGGWVVVRAFKAWFAKPASPDPWGPEVAAAMEEPDATAICPHCQCPHEATRWFCPECGRTVGQFTSLMPPLYYLELGDVFREGTRGKFRVSFLTVAGFVFFGLAGFVLIAPLFFLYPIYLWLFFRNLSRQKNAVEDEPPVIPRS